MANKIDDGKVIMPSTGLLRSHPLRTSALRPQALKAVAIAIGLAGSAWGAQALDDAGVASKLVTVPVLIPTDAAGKPMLIKRQINGKTTPVLFGAMSPEAAEILVQQVINADGKRNKPNPQFRPSNLIALEEIVQDLRKQDPSVIRAYVTDPIQESAVVPMLIDQGSNPDAAMQTARSQPVVFCPDPLVQVNVKSAQNSQTTVPCGLDFREMALFVLGPRLKDKRPSLVALPIDRMIGLLKQLKGSDGDNLRIVASPSMQALLNRLNQPASATTAPGKANVKP
jgi:hypothetical protein